MTSPILGFKPDDFEKRTGKSENIKAELYRKARDAGLELYLEFSMPSANHKKRCVADCVLVCKKRVIAIIEIKRGVNGKWLERVKKRNGRQFRTYTDLKKEYGIRIFYAARDTDLDNLVVRLKRVRKRFLSNA